MNMMKRNAKTTNENLPEVDEVQVPSKKRRKQVIQDQEDESDNEHDCSQNPDFEIPSEAEVGIVEKIELTNFMCHTFLEVNLGSNVNFVIGRNGSGKSAIMTGLVVGLGGKAATTSRGSSLKGFIKDGCSYANILIKLRNRGSDAFKPELYGDCVIVERRISLDGSSTYKLKSTDHKIISNKREELVHVLDQFNIQIDNPVSILNQDTSRSFLNSSDAGDKYKFFLKATQLEQMSSDYQCIIEQKIVIKDTLKRKSEGMPDMKEHVKQLEEKYKDIAQLKEMKESVKGLKDELVWAMVNEKKSDWTDVEKILRKEEARVPRHDEKIEECKGELDGLEGKWNATNSEINSIGEDGSKLAEEQKKVVAEVRTRKATLRSNQDTFRKKERDLHMTEKERKELVSGIEEIKATAVRDLQGERDRREQELSQKKEELNMFQAQLSTSNHHKGQLEMSVNSSKEKSYQLRIEVDDARRNRDNLKRKVGSLRGSQNNSLKIFGAWVPDVNKTIDNYTKQGQFHRPPMGPLGAHIKLKDPKWAIAIENCLKKALILAYCVHDNHDKQILEGILKKQCHNQLPPIIISKFQDRLHNVSSHRAHSNHPTVLDILQVENNNVANTLIDQAKVESVLLIEDGKEARQVMWHEQPRNAFKAYTITGDQVIGGKNTKYYSNKNRQANFLQPSVDHAIRETEKQILSIEQQLSQFQEQQTQINSEMKTSTQELQRTKHKCMKEQDAINSLQRDIQELENFEEEQLPDVTTLEEELEQCEMQIAALQEEINQATEVVNKYKQAVQEQEEMANEVKLKIDEFWEKLEPLKEELTKLDTEIQKQKSYKKHYESKKGELLGKISQVSDRVNQARSEYEATLNQAKEYCTELETDRAVKSLESEISKMEKRIQREEMNRGNAEDITRQYYEAFNKYEEIYEKLERLKKFRKRLEKVVIRRAKRFEDFRRYIVLRAKMYFVMMLSQRGYSGKMKVDHDNEKLHVQVNIEQAQGTSTKDTRSLSGGERSFSTICFIMALWEAMESPFRVLDEFDVFMDMLNRRISMHMLLKIAKEQSCRQFILLTPQDMSNIGSGDNCKIFRLLDPDRGQKTIQFPRANENGK